MLTAEQRSKIVEKIIRLRDESPVVPITLQEEAQFNAKLAEFVTRDNAAERCVTNGEPCRVPLLVPVCRRIETAGRALALSSMKLIVQRYICLNCGKSAVAAVERHEDAEADTATVVG